MNSLSKVQLLFIIGAIALVAVIYAMPKTAPLSAEAVVETTAVDAVELSADEKITEAIAVVMKGEEPMKGIMMLRDVLQEDPKNIKAHLTLGMFSIQSGQLEKALDRFTTVLSIDSSESEAYLYLAEVHEKLGQRDLAIENLETYKTLVEDSNSLAQVQIIINELKKI